MGQVDDPSQGRQPDEQRRNDAPVAFFHRLQPQGFEGLLQGLEMFRIVAPERAVPAE
jgi:hypothetical protein